MTGARFFSPIPAGLSAAEIAKLVGVILPAGASAERRISSIASLDVAGPDDLAFLDKPKYAEGLANTRAGICLIAKRFEGQTPACTIALVSPQPYRAFVAAARVLFPEALRPIRLTGGAGISVHAHVDTTARLESGVVVEPAAVVGPGAEIGAGTVIGPGAVIGPRVRIGRNCVVGAGATLIHALLGDRVIVHAGGRIGQDGFGYVMGLGGHKKVPQVGRVIIQDDVEIGANSTIDRGGLTDTVIGEGTKIDNLVQIGHNVRIGRHCIIVSQCGLSGSVTLEDYAVLGGKVGVADHVTIGQGAQVGAGSGVMNDIPPGQKWLGYPAMQGSEYFRKLVTAGRRAKVAPVEPAE